MAHKIIYSIEVKQANGEKVRRVVEATNKSQAIRHAAKDTIEATVMSSKEVSDWYRSGGTVEVAAEDVQLTAAQVGELVSTPGATFSASLDDGDIVPSGGLPVGDR